MLFAKSATRTVSRSVSTVGLLRPLNHQKAAATTATSATAAMTAVTRERGGAAAAISPDGGRAAAPESDNGTDDEAGNGADDGKVFDDSEPGTPELAGAGPSSHDHSGR